MIEDKINAIFECMGSIFVFFSIKKLYLEKKVKGVDYKTVAFFTCWGFWNIYYYPCISQWASFLAGLFVTMANLIWVIQIIYYSFKK